MRGLVDKLEPVVLREDWPNVGSLLMDSLGHLLAEPLCCPVDVGRGVGQRGAQVRFLNAERGDVPRRRRGALLGGCANHVLHLDRPLHRRMLLPLLGPAQPGRIAGV